MREVTKHQQSRYRQESEEDESSSDEQSSQQEEQNQALINAQIQRIQQQLKSMPYEVILKQKKMEQEKQTPSNKKQPNTPKIKKLGKKKHIQKVKHDKNEAVQVSIHQKQKKKHVDIFEPKRKKAIDPRFQSYAGHYNSDLAMKSYDFIPKLQQAEITELKDKLKNKAKRGKLTPHQREVLTNEYNRVTSDFKRVQLSKLQQQTKKEMKQTYGEGFHIKKNTFRQEFQQKKLANLSQADREKKLREKDNKVRRNQLNERRKTLNMNPGKRSFSK